MAGFADTLPIVEPDPVPEEGESAESFARRSLERVFSAEFLRDHFDLAVPLATASPGTVERVGRLDEEAYSDDDSVDVETLVIEGGHDRIVSKEHPARYLAELPGARHEVVLEASHGWLMEAPAAFASKIAALVRGLG